MFVGFACTPDIIETSLTQMITADENGDYDRLLDFVEALSHLAQFATNVGVLRSERTCQHGERAQNDGGSDHLVFLGNEGGARPASLRGPPRRSSERGLDVRWVPNFPADPGKAPAPSPRRRVGVRG